MDHILAFIIFSLLGVLAYQDFKNREISWLLLPALMVAFILRAMQKISSEELLLYFTINSSLIITILIGVIAIVSIKEKKLTLLVDTHLGLGDILFFFVLTVIFSPINFIVFFLGSIALISLIYGVKILIDKETNTLIPLAGGMSILLSLVLIVDPIYDLGLYEDKIML